MCLGLIVWRAGRVQWGMAEGDRAGVWVDGGSTGAWWDVVVEWWGGWSLRRRGMLWDMAWNQTGKCRSKHGRRDGVRGEVLLLHRRGQGGSLLVGRRVQREGGCLPGWRADGGM